MVISSFFFNRHFDFKLNSVTSAPRYSTIMNTTQNQLNSSSEELSDYVNYCRETTAIRTSLATDESIITQVNTEENLQLLLAAQAKIDAKIETTEKRIKIEQAEVETLNRDIFKAEQYQNRSLACLKSTGERVEVVEKNTKNIKNIATEIKVQQEKVINKLKQNAEEKQKCQEYVKQIAVLEEKIEKSTNAPEPEFNSKLVEENNNLKANINHYKEQFKLKQIKVQKSRELKNEKTELLRQIQEKQQMNNLLTEQLDNKKKYLNEQETAIRTKFLELREKISKKNEVVHQLQQDFQETNQRSTSLKNKVDELKSIIAEKDMQLQNLRDNLSTEMYTPYEEKVTKQKQQDLESAKLKTLENELQDALKETEIKLKAIMEKSNQLYQLKEEKEELMGQIYIQKNLVTTRQHDLTEERNKLDAISEKYTEEQIQVTMFKNKHQTLTENIDKIKTELDVFVKEKEARQILELEFSGKIHELQKEIDLKNANINILMDFELEPALKKLDDVKGEIKSIEQRKRTEEIHYNMLIQLSEKKNKRINIDKSFVAPKPVSASVHNTSLVEAENKDSQPASGRKSPGIVKTPLKPPQAKIPISLTSHKSEPSISHNRTKKVKASVRNTSLVEAGNEKSQLGTSRKSPGTIKSPLIPKPSAATVKKVNTSDIEEELVEAETADTREPDGRRSPGILKSPLLKPPNVGASKRVTFHGVSSSESSSTSVVDDGGQKDLDEVLKAWSQFSSSKRNLDF